jgi:hypothetical protein
LPGSRISSAHDARPSTRPFIVCSFDNRSAAQVQDAGRPVDLRPEDRLKIELLRQAPFRKYLLGQAEIGFVLLDRPFPFRPVRPDAVLTIRLQGLDPACAGSPDTQAQAAALENPVGCIEIGGDLVVPWRAFRIGRPQMRLDCVD